MVVTSEAVCGAAEIKSKSISVAIRSYKKEFSEIPKVGPLKELLNLDDFRGKYLKKMPLKDPWGNHYYYKLDDQDSRKFWLASAGVDGNFEGFKQKGQDAPKSDDIVLTDDNNCREISLSAPQVDSMPALNPPAICPLRSQWP